VIWPSFSRPKGAAHVSPTPNSMSKG
jgi:hypothetical protein